MANLSARCSQLECCRLIVFVSYKQKYVHEVLVNRLVKLAQEVWLGELTIPT